MKKFGAYHGQYGTYLSLFTLIGLFVIFTNNEQVYSLFHPVSERLSPYGYHHPYIVDGFFNSELWLPQWEHQLREGLLLSGLASMFVAAYLVVKKTRSRGFFSLR